MGFLILAKPVVLGLLLLLHNLELCLLSEILVCFNQLLTVVKFTFSLLIDFGFALSGDFITPLLDFIDFLCSCHVSSSLDGLFSLCSFLTCASVIYTVLLIDLLSLLELFLLLLELCLENDLSLSLLLFLLLDSFVSFEHIELVEGCPLVNLRSET